MRNNALKYLFIGVLSMILLVYSTATLIYPLQKSLAATYKQSAYTIYYPADWTVNRGNERHVLFLAPNLHPGSATYRSPQLYVNVSDSTGLSLLPFMVNNDIKNFSSGLRHFKLLSNTPFTFQGNTAYQLVYTYKDPSFGKVQEMRVWLIGGSKYYDIDFNAKTSDYRHYLPTVQTMVNSFTTPAIGQAGVITQQVSGPCQALKTALNFAPIVSLAGPEAAAGVTIGEAVGSEVIAHQCNP